MLINLLNLKLISTIFSRNNHFFNHFTNYFRSRLNNCILYQFSAIWSFFLYF